MTCARVETLLALHVEGDLGADASRAVEAHMAECPGCRAEAAAYKRSQSFLREDGPAPFDERDYAEIRRAVREQLAEKASRSTIVRRVTGFFLEGKRGTPALAAAACLLLVAAIALRPFQKHTQEPPRAAAAQALFPSKQIPLRSPELSPVVRTSEAQALFPSEQKTSITVARKPPLLARAAIASAVSRIELQTENPNVRIIWLVGSQPARPHELETDSEDGI